MIAPAEGAPMPAPLQAKGRTSEVLGKLARAAVDKATHLRVDHQAKKVALTGSEDFETAKNRLRGEAAQAKFEKNTLGKFDHASKRLERTAEDPGQARKLAFESLSDAEQSYIAQKITTELGENAPDYVVAYNDARAEAESAKAFSGMGPKEQKSHLDWLLEGRDGDPSKLPEYAKPLHERIQMRARVREADKRSLADEIRRNGNLDPGEALRAAELGLKLRPQDVEDVVVHLITLSPEERQQLIEEEPLLKGYEDVMKAVVEKGKEFHDASLDSERISENMEAQKGFVEQTVNQFLETKQKLAEAEANASGELTPKRTAQIMLDHELQVPLDKLNAQSEIGDKVDAAVAGEVIAREIAKNDPELEGTAAVRVMEAKKSALLTEVDAGLNKTEKDWGTADTEKAGGTKTLLETERAIGPVERLKLLTGMKNVEEALQTVDSAIFSPDTVEAVALVMTGDVDVARSLGEYWAKAKQYSEHLSDPSLRAEVEDKILGPQKEQLKAAIAVVIERGGTPFTEEGLQLLKKGVVLDGKDVPVVRDGSGKIIKILDQLPAETQARWEKDGVDSFGNPRMVKREYVAKDLVYGVQPKSAEEAFAMMESLMSNLSIESGAGGSEKAKMFIAESNIMSIRMQQEFVSQKMSDRSISVAEQSELAGRLDRLNNLSAVLEKTQSLVAAESGYHSLQALKNLITNGELGDIAAHSSVEEFTRAVEKNEHLTDEQKQSLKLLFGEKTNAFSYEVAGIRLYTEPAVREVERVFDRAHLIASAKEVSFEEYNAAYGAWEYAYQNIDNKAGFVHVMNLVEGTSLAMLEYNVKSFEADYRAQEQQLAGHYNRRAEMQSKLAAMEKRVGEIVQENSAQRQVAEATIPDLTKEYSKLHRDVVGLELKFKTAVRQRAKIEARLDKIRVSIKTAPEIEAVKKGIKEADAAVRDAEKALKRKEYEENEVKKRLNDEKGKKQAADKSNNAELRKTIAEQKKILMKDLREVDELIAGFEDIDPQTGKTRIESLKELYESAKNDFERGKAILDGRMMERSDEENFAAISNADRADQNLERMRRGLLATIDITGEWPEGFMPEMKAKMQGGLPKSVADKRKVLDEEAVKGAKADFEGPESTMKAFLEHYQLGEVADDQLKEQLVKAVEAQGDTSKQSVDAIVESALAIWREAGFVDDEGAKESVARLLKQSAFVSTAPIPFEELEKKDSTDSNWARDEGVVDWLKESGALGDPNAIEEDDIPSWLKKLSGEDEGEEPQA